MKKSVKNRVAGILIVTLLVIALALFMAILVKTQMLPVKFLLLAGGIFLLYAVCVFFLTRNSQRVGAMTCGCLMTMLLLIALMVGTPYLMRAVETLDNITNVEVEIADMGVYVKTDSSATELKDLSGGKIGIMDVLDRENTDKTLEDIQGQIGSVEVQEYAGLGELVDGILAEEVDAAVINQAYLDLLQDMEGYEDADSQLREIYRYQAESQIRKPAEEPSQNDKWSILDIFSNEEKPGDEADGNGQNVFSVYISGIDSRGGLNAKGRSDVNIIATVNVDTRQVLLISTPRDYYVPLPMLTSIP